MAQARPLAVITGASSGIGEAFARRLAAGGYDLLLVARRKDRLDQLAAQLQRLHGICAEAVVADLTRDGALQFVEERIAAAPSLEFLVNNAGFGTLGRFFAVSLDGQDRMHRLHVLATVRLTHAALVGMVARNRGSIVNVASVAGFAQSPGNTSYCATKAWMNSFSEGLYLELKSSASAVRVQALCPGYTITEFHDTLGIGRRFAPASWWMSADEVVEASLRGLAKNRLFVIPGWRYRLFVFIMGLAPRRLRHVLALRYIDRSRRRSRSGERA